MRKYSSQLQSNGKVTLTIEDCLQEDAGEITIIVENRAGSTQCSAELIVERKLLNDIVYRKYLNRQPAKFNIYHIVM